eukprot:evm.model.scf_590.6 EVM.evm.TU.scf_590.6   scf_590:31886-32251(-)
MVASAPKKARTTPFQERLYQVCKRIPKGKVATYGMLAKAVGSCPRAVGQALRNNPYAPRVPCHRVVAGTLQIGGFGGQWGEDQPNIAKKKKMLMEEGVAFDGFKVAGLDYVAEDRVLRADK